MTAPTGADGALGARHASGASTGAAGTATGAAGDGVSRRLGIVPTAVAVTALSLHLVGLGAAGLFSSSQADPRRSLHWTALATLLMLASLVSGHSAGMYGGLAVSATLALTVEPRLGTASAVIVAGTIVAVHEIARFSLDARRPSRFGPGLIRTYALRSAGVAILVMVLTGLLWSMASTWPADGRTVSRWALPLGIAAAGVPLSVGWAVQRAGRSIAGRPPRSMRIGLGLAAGIAIGLAVVAGAVARTGIETGDGPPTAEVTTTTTAPPTAPVVFADPREADARTVALIALLLLSLALVLLFAVLRRPEAVFELDEKAFDDDHGGLGLSAPSRADFSQELIGLDDGRVGRLLDDLSVDLSSEPDPGRAIRFGYAGVERRLSAMGLERGDAETEQEFLHRALPTLRSQGRSLTDLTRLFERARFSDQPVTETMRTAALSAIDGLRAATGTERPTGSDAGPTAAAGPDAAAAPHIGPGAEPDPGSNAGAEPGPEGDAGVERRPDPRPERDPGTGG